MKQVNNYNNQNIFVPNGVLSQNLTYVILDIKHKSALYHAGLSFDRHRINKVNWNFVRKIDNNRMGLEH